MSVALGEEHCQCCHHLNCFKVVLSYAGVIVLKLLTINCPSNCLHRSWDRIVANLPIKVQEIPQTNGLQKFVLKKFGSKTLRCNVEIMFLHHHSESVVHGLNKFTCGVSEGDTTQMKIFLEVI